MTITRARGSLLSIFIISFVVALGSIVIPFIKSEIYSDSMLTMLTKLFAVYSVPLAVIIGGIFGQRKSQLKSAPRIAFWSALGLALLWNGVVLWRVVVFAIDPDDRIGALTAYLDTVVPASYFLLAGVLSYFFATRE